MTDAFIDPERAAFEAFKDLPRDTPIEMINLVRYRGRANYPSEHPCADLGLSGADAYRRYAAESRPVFARVGGTVVWTGQPQLTLIGPPDERWDAAFIARYPNAAAFLEMVAEEAYRAAVVHRQAALETSRLIRSAPRDR